jgi:hypothetical protein
LNQCPSCSGNVADFVAVCPYCGAAVAVAQAPQFAGQSAFSGPPQNSGKALASLICGVVFFFWPLSAVAAIVLGIWRFPTSKEAPGVWRAEAWASAAL